jgi:COMPASS component SWD3
MVETSQIIPIRQLTCDRSDVFTIRWSNTGDQLSIGTSNGFAQLYDSAYEQIQLINCQSGAEKMPVSTIRYRPEPPDSVRKPALLLTTCDGGVLHWNLARSKPINSTRLRNDQFYSSDFNAAGTMYLLGCNEGKIKLFDENTFSQTSQFCTFTEGESKGAQRVFCVKWLNDNLFLSAGWDDKVTIWDQRSHNFVREMLGPHVCGESIDVKENTVAVGSYHIKDQLTIWDLGSGRNIFTSDLNFEGKKCMPYCLQFIPETCLFAVGGAGADEVYVYDSNTCRLVNTVRGLGKTVFSMHISVDKKLAVAVGNHIAIYAFK